MCGLTGIAAYKRNPIENIKAMNLAIIKRGPDADGHWLDEGARVVLGHRRLSIIDLSEAGAQPIVSDDGRYVLVYNGEIYNAEAIREELDRECNVKITWHGHSDTEVLLNAIEVWGVDKTLGKCRGMWAFALYDRANKAITLSRDRMGEKPLYYGTVNGQFVFASNIAAIKAIDGFDNRLNTAVLDTYFTYGYIPAPYSIYEGIYKLPAGEILTIVSPFTKWETRKIYDIEQVALDGQAHPFTGTEQEAADELERLLKGAIKGQMMSDVPLGAFLSGGIDSSLTVSLMQSLSDIPIRTFTIGFDEEKYNEAEYASQTAAHLGTKHTQMYVGYDDVMEILPSLPQAFGEPFADSSQLPTMLVSKMTKQHVTVSLSGDAGDEFYCGYNTYRCAQNNMGVMRGKIGMLKDPLRGTIGNALLKSPLSQNALIRKTGRCLSVSNVEDYYRMVLDSDVRMHRLPLGLSKALPTQMSEYVPGTLSTPESNLMLMDMKQYLPDDILVKVDRAGMQYSLETRIPLLDADVMQFAWSLPLEYKMKDGVTKRPLRNILYKYVPEEMMNRPKKGFSVPVGIWLREGQMREWAESIIEDAKVVAKDYIDTKLVDRMWHDYIAGGEYSVLIWYVLMLEQWMLQM
ncbi:MAG: asparagine synthase (glutamine-hydrolyzing) [Lachnospiraceae bacterium]|nr:asparagine synthase (glutamine-hydrolyzing) [Candidatus Colinaster equi]